MNDSAANVDCGPFGSRRLPVRSGVSQTSGRLDDLAGHPAIGNRVHIGRQSRRCRRRVWPAAIPSVARSAPYRARCSRRDCSRTNGHCSRSATRRPCGIQSRRASSPGMPGPWYPTPSPRPASTACEPAGRFRARSRPPRKPASSAAVRPKPCGPCIQTTRTLSCGMPRNVATPLRMPYDFMSFE